MHGFGVQTHVEACFSWQTAQLRDCDTEACVRQHLHEPVSPSYTALSHAYHSASPLHPSGTAPAGPQKDSAVNLTCRSLCSLVEMEAVTCSWLP